MNEEELRRTLEARGRDNIYWKITYGNSGPMRLLWDGEIDYIERY